MAPQTTAFNLGALSDGGELLIDRESLLRQKLLVQASSGGGKSRTLRRLAEQAFGNVPIVIIDPEGEFASLRERYDFLLVSKEGGDAQVNVDTAALLARRLLETRVSAVVDLFETKGPLKHLWLKRFFDAAMEAPRELWTDFLFMVDEGENFCPEKGEGESVAKDSVLDMAQRGRKRGFGLALATLRVARLDKTCLAELHNKLVGLTTMDTDLDRAANGMGIRRGKPRHEFQEQLSNLDPGHFFARGPGFRPACKAPTAVHIGEVVTTHPKPGASKQLPAPPPTARIKHLLPKFAELAVEAAEEDNEKTRVERELRAEIARLEGEVNTLTNELSAAEQSAATAINDAAAVESAPVEVPTVPKGLQEALGALTGALDKSHGALTTLALELATLIVDVGHMQDGLTGVAELGAAANGAPPAPVRTFMLGDAHTEHVSRAQQRRERRAQEKPAPPPWTARHVSASGEFDTRNNAPTANHAAVAKTNGEWKIRDGVRRMLVALAMTWNPDGLTERQLATLADVKITGGTWGIYLKELLTHGAAEERNGRLRLTQKGRQLAGPQRRPVGGAAILDYWLSVPVVRGKCKDLLTYIVKRVGRGKYIERDAWGDACDVATTGGTLGTYIGLLAANGLVIPGAKGHYTPADFFYS